MELADEYVVVASLQFGVKRDSGRVELLFTEKGFAGEKVDARVAFQEQFLTDAQLTVALLEDQFAATLGLQLQVIRLSLHPQNHELLLSDPIFHIFSTHSFQQCSDFRRDSIPFTETVGQTIHFFNQLFLVFALPWCNACQQLVEDDSHREDVTGRRVNIFDKGLYRHVERSTHIVLGFDLFLAKNGKSEICDLPIFPIVYYVCRFEVPVQNASSQQVLHALNDLLHDGHRHAFFQLSSSGQIIQQIPALTQFSDNVTVSLRLVYIEALDHVGMVQSLQNLYLTLQHSQTLFAVFFEFNDFDSHFQAVFGGLSSIDFTAVS